MPRLLADEQVTSIAKIGAEGVAELIWIARSDLEEGRVELLQEAVEHDLTTCLEGLMEPEESEGSDG